MKKIKVICSLILMATLVFSTTNTFAALVSEHLPDYDVGEAAKISSGKPVTTQTNPGMNGKTANVGLDKLVDGNYKGNNRTVIYANTANQINSIDERKIVQATIDLGAKYDINKVVIMNGYGSATATATAASWMYGKLNVYGSNDPACALAEASTCTHEDATCNKGKWKTANKTLIGNMEVDFEAGEISYTFSLANEFVSGTAGYLGKNVVPDEKAFRYIIIATDGIGMSGQESITPNINVGDVEVYGTEYVASGVTNRFVTDYRPFVSNNENFTHGFKAIDGFDATSDNYRIYTAVFDKNDRLIDVEVKDITSDTDLTTLKNTVNIPEDGAYVKSFLWTADDMTPISEFVEAKGTTLVSRGIAPTTLAFTKGCYIAKNGTEYPFTGLTNGSVDGSSSSFVNYSPQGDGYQQGALLDLCIDLGRNHKIGVIRIAPRSSAASTTKGVSIYGFSDASWIDTIKAREGSAYITADDISANTVNGTITKLYEIGYNLKGKDVVGDGNYVSGPNCMKYENNIVLTFDGSDTYRYIMCVSEGYTTFGELEVYAINE